MGAGVNVCVSLEASCGGGGGGGGDAPAGVATARCCFAVEWCAWSGVRRNAGGEGNRQTSTSGVSKPAALFLVGPRLTSCLRLKETRDECIGLAAMRIFRSCL